MLFSQLLRRRCNASGLLWTLTDKDLGALHEYQS